MSALAVVSGITTVAYQGEPGAFSEEAAGRLCPGARAVPTRTFAGVAQAVEAGAVEAGLLPVENSLAGGVMAAWEALRCADLTVRAETVMPIRLCVAGVEAVPVEEVVSLRSHPVALQQCQRFLAAHPWVEPVAVTDTAGAAREVAESGDPTWAAVASRTAADRWGLHVIAADVQDRPDNQTRFYLVTRRTDVAELDAPAAAGYKTALWAEVENRPGSLHDLLGVFARRALDLCFVASRPAATPWTYRFILEVAHGDPSDTRAALDELATHAARHCVLGVFPAWAPDARATSIPS